jgi:hypothetical protein
MAPRPVAQNRGQKNSCCVTTRRYNFWTLRCLRRGRGTLTARTFRLGVLRFGRIVLAPPGLPPRRLPAPHLPQAFGILAVTLIPTPRLVLAPTAFAQANPRPRSSRPGTAAALWINMAPAHGSVFSQGTARGERAIVLLGRLSKPRSRRSFPNLYFTERQGRKLLEKGVAKDTIKNTQAPALFKRSQVALFYCSVPACGNLKNKGH